MDFFAACPEMRDSARRVLPVLHGRAGRRVTDVPAGIACWRTSAYGHRLGDRCGPGMGSLQSHFARKKQPRTGSLQAGPFAGVFLLAGRKYRKKSCERRASSVDASLRCGKSTKPYGKVAQLVRACGLYPQCRGFKSLPCYQKLTSGSGLSRTAFLLWLYL